MQILEPHGQRFEVALELLREGRSFSFDGVSFSLGSNGQLIVAIESSFWPPENITEQTALRDLERAKNVADYLAKENAAFATTVENHPQLFILLNYYGHGGEVEWARPVEGVYSEMQERGLSARVVRYTHAVLSSSLKQAVNWGMLARNPAELV